MNTNMMTICNIIAQKTGVGDAVLNKNSTENGQWSTEETNSSQETTDNNCDKSKNKRNKNGESKFNDALRKKMEPETSGQVPVSKNKEGESLNKDKSDVHFRDMPNPAYIIQEKLEKKVGVVQEGNRLSPEILKDTLAANPENGESGVKVGVPASGNHIADTEQQEQTSQQPIFGDAVVSETSESVENPVFNVENTENLLPDKNSSGFGESPTLSQLSQNMPQAQGEQPQKTVEDSILSQQSETQTETPSAQVSVPKTNISMEQPQNMAEASISSAKSDAQTEIPSGQASEDKTNILTEQPQKTDETSILFEKSRIQTEMQAAKASTHKMNISREQVESLKAVKDQNFSENEDFNADMDVDGHEQLSVETTSSSTIAEKPPISGDTIKINVNSNSELGLGRQIQESVSSFYRPGTQQMIIRLDPPDLGRITIRFTEQRDGITGVLHVDKSQTKQEIQQALPGIVQHLQNSDVQIKKLEVVLNEQPQNDTAEEQSANQNGSFGEQNSPDQNSLGNPLSHNEWRANLDNLLSDSTDPQMELTDKSINMLI